MQYRLREFIFEKSFACCATSLSRYFRLTDLLTIVARRIATISLQGTVGIECGSVTPGFSPKENLIHCPFTARYFSPCMWRKHDHPCSTCGYTPDRWTQLSYINSTFCIIFADCCLLRSDVTDKEITSLFYFMTSSTKSAELLLSSGSAWILMALCTVVSSSFAKRSLWWTTSTTSPETEQFIYLFIYLSVNHWTDYSIK